MRRNDVFARLGALVTTFSGAAAMAFPLRNLDLAVHSALEQLDRPGDLLASIV